LIIQKELICDPANFALLFTFKGTILIIFGSLLIIAYTLITKKGYKVRSTAGHHIKILEKLSQLLKDEDILVLGNKMRQERNVNLYDGGFFVGEKDSLEYLKFVKSTFKKAGI